MAAMQLSETPRKSSSSNLPSVQTALKRTTVESTQPVIEVYDYEKDFFASDSDDEPDELPIQESVSLMNESPGILEKPKIEIAPAEEIRTNSESAAVSVTTEGKTIIISTDDLEDVLSEFVGAQQERKRATGEADKTSEAKSEFDELDLNNVLNEIEADARKEVSSSPPQPDAVVRVSGNSPRKMSTDSRLREMLTELGGGGSRGGSGSQTPTSSMANLDALITEATGPTPEPAAVASPVTSNKSERSKKALPRRATNDDAGEREREKEKEKGEKEKGAVSVVKRDSKLNRSISASTSENGRTRITHHKRYFSVCRF
jgi:hypothetical protein